MDREAQFHQAYLKICDTIAQLSRAERKKVGAIIVKDDSIISYGFNGTPNGLDNECEIQEAKGRLAELFPEKTTKPKME